MWTFSAVTYLPNLEFKVDKLFHADKDYKKVVLAKIVTYDDLNKHERRRIGIQLMNEMKHQGMRVDEITASYNEVLNITDWDKE